MRLTRPGCGWLGFRAFTDRWRPKHWRSSHIPGHVDPDSGRIRVCDIGIVRTVAPFILVRRLLALLGIGVGRNVAGFATGGFGICLCIAPAVARFLGTPLSVLRHTMPGLGRSIHVDVTGSACFALCRSIPVLSILSATFTSLGISTASLSFGCRRCEVPRASFHAADVASCFGVCQCIATAVGFFPERRTSPCN